MDLNRRQFLSTAALALQQPQRQRIVILGGGLSGLSAAYELHQNDRAVYITLPSGQTLTADRAVCALPCPVIGAILDGARLSAGKRDAIRNQNYSRTAKVFLQARSRFWLREGFSGHVTTDLPIERLTPSWRGSLRARRTRRLPDRTLCRRVGKHVGRGPRLRRALTGPRDFSGSHCVLRWRHFQGMGTRSLATWRIRPAHTRTSPHIDVLARAEGRIHFAGEHTSPWTGWMQGAFESARRVVREIAA